LPREKKLTNTNDSVAVFSGGLDSTTLVYDLLSKDHHPVLLSFDYGQKHSKELDYADRTASKLGLEHQIVDLRVLKSLLAHSALTSDADVPEGHYAADNMKQTVVPNRNMIMLSIAAGFAVDRKLKFVATGVHAGDHFIYPDCRPLFMNYLQDAILAGNDGFHAFELHAIGSELYPMGTGAVLTPYIHMTKSDIALRALELGVPLEETWSCYKGGEVHCGKCGTCVERLEAIAEGQQMFAVKHPEPGDWVGPHPIDHTAYADSQYWKSQVTVAEPERG
jgi:7-cyano-7-deazaguanine synthase